MERTKGIEPRRVSARKTNKDEGLMDEWSGRREQGAPMPKWQVTDLAEYLYW
jgi:hypothetical protein